MFKRGPILYLDNIQNGFESILSESKKNYENDGLKWEWELPGLLCKKKRAQKVVLFILSWISELTF
jgi:hypothetical protein